MAKASNLTSSSEDSEPGGTNCAEHEGAAKNLNQYLSRLNLRSLNLGDHYNNLNSRVGFLGKIVEFRSRCMDGVQ
jgi:hypothetical protein